MKLVDYLADEFMKENSIDLRKDKLSLQRLTEAAKIALEKLQQEMRTEVHLPFISVSRARPLHLKVMLVRAKLERMIDELQ